ncbi:unnamed protein product [Nesidiocoris tenuis]|uniref:Uncharacterized protein n=1 Tax=Nesidiocoris tenuis TaxID=355587 RepID=A0A6H5HM82_9HEMI|nr:unnamed protein product [Nesidiocoris tenuis]
MELGKILVMISCSTRKMLTFVIYSSYWVINKTSNPTIAVLIGEDTYLFDAYRLHVPGSKAPYVLLSSASTVDIHKPPPPFQTPPSLSLTPFGITTSGDKAAVIGEEEQAPLEFPTDQDYYKGVPILVPEGLGKISLHVAVVKKLMDQLIVQA